MRKALNIFIFILFCKFSFANLGEGNRSLASNNPLYKKITKSELIHLIDSLLEKDTITFQEITQLKYFSGILKNRNQATYEIETNIESDTEDQYHFYSESEENLLFPPFPLNDLPKEFNILLENPQSRNYSNPFNGVLTSYYGWRDKRMHKGIDIDLNKGEPVVAAFDGKVRIAKKNGGFGNVIILMHASGLETVYAHLSKIKVKPGQIVLSGQTIGLGGNSGKSRGSHLHFETRYKGHAINPLTIISYFENKLYHHSIRIKTHKLGLSAYPSNADMHLIQKGESWNLLSKKYNIPIKELLILNGGNKRFYLKCGSTLRVK